jgi:Flp pilus assembly protein TadG
MQTRCNTRKNQGGQAIVMFTFLVASVLVPMVGLAIDGGRGYLVRLKLSSAVDGGALAAARLIGTGSNATQQLANAKATAAQYVSANFPANFFGANLPDPTNPASVCVDPGTDSSDPCGVGNGSSVSTYKVRTVAVNATATMPTLFMRILGMPTVTVAAKGLASRRDVRVVVVVDRSSSMSGFFGTSSTSVIPMAQKFVNSFSGSGDLGGRDELGLVVFGGSGIVAYPPRDVTKDYTDYTQFSPPDNNFKSSNNIPKYLNDIASGSNTGTAEALYLAYMTLRADAATNTDLATKLNVIVLFTDGIPNGVTAWANDPNQGNINFMMSSSSGCPNLSNGRLVSPLVAASNNNMIGWFAQGGGSTATGANANKAPKGLFTPMMAYKYSSSYTGRGDDIDTYMKNPGGDTNWITQANPASGGGCTHGGNGGDNITGLTNFPPHDLYGNYIDLTNNPPPAVNGLSMPTGDTGRLYEKGTLWSTTTQCNGAAFNNASTNNACQVALASWQAAAHQAWKIWNQIVWDKATQTNKIDPSPNLSSPVIFTIGFDHSATDKPDMKLLQLIANDPGAPVSFSSRIKGQAFYATDPSAVDFAFQQIASEILRLSQ